MPTLLKTARRRRKTRSGSDSEGAAQLYWSLQELVRVYQFRDKDRVCGYGLTPGECYALECLARSGPMMLNELARMLYSEKSTVSRIVASLEAKGHCRRETDAEDGRAVRLSPTPAGRKLHDRIMRAIIAEQQRILADLPANVRRGLPIALAKLAESAALRCGAARMCSPDGGCA